MFCRILGHLRLLFGDLFKFLLKFLQLLDLLGKLLGALICPFLFDGVFQLFFDLSQAADHGRLLGDGLFLVFFEQLSGCFVGGCLGLLQQRFSGRHLIQHLRQVSYRLVDLCLLFHHLLDRLFREFFRLANFLANLLLFLEQFADHLQSLFAVRTDQALRFLYLLQQCLQSFDYRLLTLRCIRKLAGLQVLAGVIQLDTHLGSLQDS